METDTKKKAQIPFFNNGLNITKLTILLLILQDEDKASELASMY